MQVLGESNVWSILEPSRAAWESWYKSYPCSVSTCYLITCLSDVISRAKQLQNPQIIELSGMTILGLPVCHAMLGVGGAGSPPVVHQTRVVGRWIWPRLPAHHTRVAGRWDRQCRVHVMCQVDHVTTMQCQVVSYPGLVCEPEASPCPLSLYAATNIICP